MKKLVVLLTVASLHLAANAKELNIPIYQCLPDKNLTVGDQVKQVTVIKHLDSDEDVYSALTNEIKLEIQDMKIVSKNGLMFKKAVGNAIIVDAVQASREDVIKQGLTPKDITAMYTSLDKNYIVVVTKASSTIDNGYQSRIRFGRSLAQDYICIFQ